MSLPWGVKEFVAADHLEDFKAYIASIVETEISLPSQNVANILKADVKEKKDKCLLIMRYQLSTLA